MKKVALCIGHSYKESAVPLSSTYIDLWTACEYFQQKGFHCYIIDDCVDLVYVNKLYIERKLPISFLNFYLLRKCTWFTKTTYRSDVIEQGLADADQFAFYYTGHITSNGFFEFGLSRYRIKNVFSYLSKLLPQDCPVFAIADGCYSGNHPFSHTLIEGELCLTQRSFPMSQQCFYLYSSEQSEKAASSRFQSYFTKYLFRELADSTSNVVVLIEKLQGRVNYRSGRNDQTIGVATSMPLPLTLWPWVFGLSFQLCDDHVLLY